MRWGLGAHKCLHLLSRVYIVQSVYTLVTSLHCAVRLHSCHESTLCSPSTLLSRVYIVQSVAEATKNTTSKVQRSFSGFELELCLPQIKFIFGLLKV